MAKNIEVITRNVNEPDKAVQRMVIEDNNGGHWKWLNKHMTWAIRTGHSVAIYPTDAAITWVDRSDRPVYQDRTRATKRPDQTARS